MSKRKTRFQLFLLGNTLPVIVVSILLFSSQPIARDNLSDILSPMTDSPIPLSYSYTPVSPMSITDDTGLAAADNGGGTGTAEDPYVIENYKIITSSAHGIYVTGTTEYFIIRNNWIEAGTAEFYGISIYGVSSGTATISDNICNNSYWGISIYDSDYAIVANNSCGLNTYAGIRIYSSTSVTATNNTCEDNNYGIQVENSDSVTLNNNTFQNNNYGIRVRSNSDFTEVRNNTVNYNSNRGISIEDGTTSSTTAANNTLQDNNYGIYISLATSSTVSNNTLLRDGIYISLSTISAYLSTTVENNTVNGLPVGYLTNVEDFTVQTAYGQLLLINCTDVIVRDQEISLCDIGFYIRFSSNIELRNNIINQNYLYGVYFYDSDFCTVINNSLSQNGMYGIYIRISNNMTVINNSVYQNDDYGIYLFESSDCTISYNEIKDNLDYGVYLASASNDNTIHHNSFIDNQRSPQAYDNTGVNTGNQWNETSTGGGNFWSDGDPPNAYSIGGGSSQDFYPLTEQPVFSEFSLPLIAMLSIVAGLFGLSGLITSQKRKKYN